MKVGILSLQGAFQRHKEMVESLDYETLLVRSPQELEAVESLIIPGGESTTMVKLLHRFELAAPLEERIKQGMPVFGTCAGMILLAKEVDGMDQYSLGAMDITVQRNGYGRQVDSFETQFTTPLSPEPLEGIFIRAPRVTRWDDQVEVLAEHRGDPVLVRQDSLMAASFHPELGDSPAVHRYFLEQC